ncbi:alpha/beta hydrolase [Francisellaceae bacterium CB300]
MLHKLKIPASFQDKKEVDKVVKRLNEIVWPEDFYEARDHYDQWGSEIGDDIEVIKEICSNGSERYILSPNIVDDNKILLYFHGGGFVFGSFLSHGGLSAELARNLKCKVMHLDYRRAPENKFPTAIDDAVTAYESLINEKGYNAKDIYLAGDSAGGGLVISTLISLKERNVELPKACVCIAPWMDFEHRGESYIFNEKLDPICVFRVFEQVRDLYLGDQNLALASPINGDFTDFPPLLIQVADREILYSDSLELAEKAESQGVTVKLEVWEYMYHVWHLHSKELSSARAAIANIVNFLKDQS